MKIDSFEIRKINLPLVRPFRTSFSTQLHRNLLVIKLTTKEGIVGWSECVALSEPVYSPEYMDGALDVMQKFLIPKLFTREEVEPEEVKGLLGNYLGTNMARSAIETAMLDAKLRAENKSLAKFLGATKDKVECGVSVGIASSIDKLLEEVSGYIAEGYRRIKLKIEPGWDYEPVKAVYESWPTMPLQVDANQAYSRDDGALLAKLDEFNLLLIEQPLDEHDILGHAQLSKQVKTPICLDESIISVEAARDALELKATTVINIKPGRVGGYFESKRIHDLCVEKGIPVWCGGMLETGIGRAANLALAALPGFTLPGDTSASARYYQKDVTTPFVMEDGYLKVPTAPGIGVDPDMDYLDSITSEKILIEPS